MCLTPHLTELMMHHGMNARCLVLPCGAVHGRILSLAGAPCSQPEWAPWHERPFLPSLQEFEWNEPSILAAGTYSAVHGVFPGCTVNGVVFAPTDSRLSNTSQVPFDAFLSVSPVRCPSLKSCRE